MHTGYCKFAKSNRFFSVLRNQKCIKNYGEDLCFPINLVSIQESKQQTSISSMIAFDHGLKSWNIPPRQKKYLVLVGFSAKRNFLEKKKNFLNFVCQSRLRSLESTWKLTAVSELYNFSFFDEQSIFRLTYLTSGALSEKNFHNFRRKPELPSPFQNIWNKKYKK